MPSFLVMLIADVLMEEVHMPLWIYAVMMTLTSYDVLSLVRRKKKVELPDGFWVELRDSYEKRS